MRVIFFRAIKLALTTITFSSSDISRFNLYDIPYSERRVGENVLRNLTNEYRHDTQGVFAIKFALFSTMLVFGTTLALETTRLVKAKSDLQSAADSATMNAAVAYLEADQEKLGAARQKGRSNFDQNTASDKIVQKSIQFEQTEQNTIHSTASLSLKPLFVNFAGNKGLSVSVESEVNIGSRLGAEIVLAVDATNSMAFDDNWDNVMETVQDTLSELETYTGKDNLYVSLVPFQDRVNIGSDKENWLAAAAPGDWNGCVEPRENLEGGFEFMLSDARPTSELFDANIPETSGWGSTTCPDFTIAGPSNDIEDLLQESEDYSTSGTGRFDIGLAWAWRLISPDWSGLWDEPNYPSANIKQRKKYIVFMTDGRSSAYEREFSQERDWAYNEGSIDGFEHLEALCSNIKEDDIELFVLRFAGNDNSIPYLRNCASEPSHYFDLNTVEDIAYPFDHILSQFASDIRLVK